MNSPLSTRVKSVPLSGIRMIFEKANQMSGVIRLEVGEPDFNTPRFITDAAKQALDEGFTHYTSSSGILPLREAIAAKLKRDNGIDVDPATEVVVTPGAGPAVYLSLVCTLNPGEEVLLPDPAWPHYEACVVLAGGKAVRYPTQESQGFRPDFTALRRLISDKTKAILINSPSNPMGSVLTRTDLEEIADIANEKDLLVFSDEIYEKVIYDGSQHYSIASLSGMKERTVTINALSKTYAMTGWRIGYAATRSDIITEMVKMNLYANGCASSFTQKAAVRALTGPQTDVARMLDEYSKRRDLVVKRLNEIEGISCSKPAGAFYTFPRVSVRGLNSLEASMFLLDSARVATVPGSSFGKLGEGHVRLSYAASLATIEQAMDRIEKALSGVKQSARTGRSRSRAA